VYKRRQPIDEPQPTPASTPDPSLEVTHHEESPSTSNPSLPQTEPTNLYLPIAIRKGIRTCTKHPLANYLSYHRLSPNHRGFLILLDAIIIPKLVEEDLKDLKWKEAMLEEMRALKKNHT